MPKQIKPITVTSYIKVDGVNHCTNEYSKEKNKEMFSEMTRKALLQLGYTPVKTA